MRHALTLLLLAVLVTPTCAGPLAQPWEKAAEEAAAKQPMTVAEAEEFVRKLHGCVREHHLKSDPKAPQKGMLCEYFDGAAIGCNSGYVRG
jgi:hypothetical protein